MKESIRVLLAATLIAVTNVASAAPLRLDAVSLLAGLGDFHVLFDDTGDRVLQLAEVSGFSGVRFLGDFYPTLLVIGESGGYTTPSAVVAGCGTFNGIAGWCFGESSGTDRLGASGAAWSFASSQVRVSEPGTLALVSLGLGGLALSRRRLAA